MARTFDVQGFVKEFKVAKKDETQMVKAGKAKRCTREGCECGNVVLKVEAFYRDKSQASGRSPWCKAAERAYNAEYYAKLKKQGVARLSDVQEKPKVVKVTKPKAKAAKKTTGKAKQKVAAA